MANTPLSKGHRAALERATEINNRIQDIPKPVVVEVGVNRGNLSKCLLGMNINVQLYLVDNWKGSHLQPEAYKLTRDRNAHRNQADAENAMRIVEQIQYKYKERCWVLRGDSVDIAKNFKDKSVDLIFLDADHSYEGVSADIEAWLPKTRMWIGGHDYRNPQPQFDFTGVDRAVEEVFGEVEVGKNVTWFKRVN